MSFEPQRVRQIGSLQQQNVVQQQQSFNLTHCSYTKDEWRQINPKSPIIVNTITKSQNNNAYLQLYISQKQDIGKSSGSQLLQKQNTNSQLNFNFQQVDSIYNTPQAKRFLKKNYIFYSTDSMNNILEQIQKAINEHLIYQQNSHHHQQIVGGADLQQTKQILLTNQLAKQQQQFDFSPYKVLQQSIAMYNNKQKLKDVFNENGVAFINFVLVLDEKITPIILKLQFKRRETMIPNKYQYDERLVLNNKIYFINNQIQCTTQISKLSRKSYLAFVKIHYSIDNQVFIVKTFDQYRKQIHDKMGYKFTHNESREFNVLVPYLDLVLHQIFEYGVFTASVVHQNIQLTSELIHLKQTKEGEIVALQNKKYKNYRGDDDEYTQNVAINENQTIIVKTEGKKIIRADPPHHDLSHLTQNKFNGKASLQIPDRYKAKLSKIKLQKPIKIQTQPAVQNTLKHQQNVDDVYYNKEYTKSNKSNQQIIQGDNYECPLANSTVEDLIIHQQSLSLQDMCDDNMGNTNLQSNRKKREVVNEVKRSIEKKPVHTVVHPETSIIEEQQEEIKQQSVNLQYPVTMKINKQTNKIFTDFEVTINVYVESIKNIQFKLINQYQQNHFQTSKSFISHDLIQKRSYKLHFQFSTSDIGGVPHLLISDSGNFDFLIPLLDGCIQTDEHFQEQYQQVKFQCTRIQCVYIEPFSQHLEYGYIQQFGNNLVLKTDDESVLCQFLDHTQLEVINPAIFQDDIPFHAMTVQALQQLNDCQQIFNRILTLKNEYFMESQYFDVLCAMDELQALQFFTINNLIVKYNQNYFFLNFSIVDDCDKTFLTFMHHRKLLFTEDFFDKQLEILINTLQQQNYKKNAIFDYEKYKVQNQLIQILNADKTFQQQSSQSTVNQHNYDYCVNESLQYKESQNIMKIICTASLNNQLQVCSGSNLLLDARFTYKQIAAVVCNQFVSHTYLVNNELLPTDNDDVERIYNDQNEQKIEFYGILLMMNDRVTSVKLTIFQDSVSLQFTEKADKRQLADIEFKQVKYTEFNVLLTSSDSILFIYQNQSYTIKIDNEREFLKLIVFFGK